MLAYFMKVFVWLLIACGVGYLVGWMSRGLALTGLRDKNNRLTSDLSARDSQARTALSQMQDLRAKQAFAETEIATLRTKNKELTSAIYAELQNGIENADNLRLELERHKSEIELASQRQKELEDTTSRLNEIINNKESESAQLKLELAPLLSLPGTLAARESELAEIRLKHDEAVAELAKYTDEWASSRNSLEAQNRQREELLASRSLRINELEGQLASANSRLTDLESIALGHASELTRVNEQLASSVGIPSTLAALESELMTAQKKLEEAARSRDQEFSDAQSQFEVELSQARKIYDIEVSELKAQVASLSHEMQHREGSLSALRAELQSASNALESLSKHLRESDVARVAAVGALRAKDAEITHLKSELSNLTILPDKLTAIKGKLSYERQRILSLEAELLQMVQTLEEGSWQTPRQFTIAPDETDDLKRIYGVDPVVEKTLQNLGVYQFRQVALWSTDDIKFFDSQLDDFRGRIEREHWVRSAQEEHYKKYGEWLGEGQPSITMLETNS